MKQIKVAVAGLGGRGRHTYVKRLENFPDLTKVVAIADPDPEKLAAVQAELGLSDDMCFESAEAMLEKEKLADVMFICTMDRQHYAQSIAAMEKGYDLLLEKPISPDMSECKKIAETANRLGRNVVVCHVLRYTPFYQTVKKLIDEGRIGDTVAIQATEPVGFWHQAHSFVRGNWRNSEETSPMILQKSCHDMDILTWLAGGSCRSVSSIGDLKEFKPERAPIGAGERCTCCEISESCPFNAVKFYTTMIENNNTDWPVNIVMENATVDGMKEKLKTSPYGRCVYRCDNNVVDHQMVQIQMENGVIINFLMCAFTLGSREIRVMGTKGIIEGAIDSGKIKIRIFNGRGSADEEIIDVFKLFDDFSGHGGGDTRLVQDVLEIAAGQKPSGSALTSIDKSVESHYICMAAEKSRLMGGKLINIKEFAEEF